MFPPTVQRNTLTEAIIDRITHCAEESGILTKSGTKKFQSCDHFEYLWTETNLKRLADAHPTDKLDIVAAVGNSVGVIHPSNAATARMAVFLAVRGYNNTRPTPGCLNGYQRNLQIQLTAMRTSSPWPFTYKLAIGKPEDFDPEIFQHVYGNEAPMDPPKGLSDLMDAIQWHGPKFSRKHASSLTLGASESRLTSQPAPPNTVSIQNQAPQFPQFPQAPQEQQFAMNLGMMFMQGMQTMFSGGGGGMPMFGGGCGGGGMPSGGGGCGGGGMPNFSFGGGGGGMGPMFGGGGCGFGGMHGGGGGGGGASALGDFKKKRRVEALQDGADDVDPLELARARMRANKEAAKAGKTSDVPKTGKAAKKEIKALAKKAAKKDEKEEEEQDDDEDEDEDEEEENEAAEDEEEEDEDEDEEEEEDDEEESEEPLPVKKKPAARGAPLTKAEIKAAEKTIPDMPKKGEASHFLGAKIYLGKKCFRIILYPPNYATEKNIKWEKAKPTVKDLKAAKALILACKK